MEAARSSSRRLSLCSTLVPLLALVAASAVDARHCYGNNDLKLILDAAYNELLTGGYWAETIGADINTRKSFYCLPDVVASSAPANSSKVYPYPNPLELGGTAYTATYGARHITIGTFGGLKTFYTLANGTRVSAMNTTSDVPSGLYFDFLAKIFQIIRVRYGLLRRTKITWAYFPSEAALFQQLGNFTVDLAVGPINPGGAISGNTGPTAINGRKTTFFQHTCLLGENTEGNLLVLKSAPYSTVYTLTKTSNYANRKFIGTLGESQAALYKVIYPTMATKVYFSEEALIDALLQGSIDAAAYVPTTAPSPSLKFLTNPILTTSSPTMFVRNNLDGIITCPASELEQ